MQDRLTRFEVAQIEQFLESYFEKNGQDILGAQLGQFVRRAISPKTIKSVGGLKSLVAAELSRSVELVGALPSDSLYRVSAPGKGASYTAAECGSVTLPQFWDAFSNPNLDCIVAVNPATESLHVGLPSEPLPPDAKPLRKMSSEEFRVLAKGYAESQDDSELSNELLATLDQPVFYHRWISVLRARRTATENHLKSWEVTRTRQVISRLREELERAGVNSVRAAQMAAEMRPKPSKGPKALNVEQARLETPGIVPAVGKTPDLQELRALMHRAIDRMSLADLKEIRVPAGLLLEIYQKPVD